MVVLVKCKYTHVVSEVTVNSFCVKPGQFPSRTLTESCESLSVSSTASENIIHKCSFLNTLPRSGDKTKLCRLNIGNCHEGAVGLSDVGFSSSSNLAKKVSHPISLTIMECHMNRH